MISPSAASVPARVGAASAVGLFATASAEHGLGQAKRDVVADYKDPVELELMRGLKSLLDPDGLMNPGKVLPSSSRLDP